MANITWADKTEAVDPNNPSPNEQVTPQDMNEIKTAVNSKEDKDNKVTNFNNPNHTDYPTTAGVVAELGNYAKARGVITGAQDLNSATYKQSGFYTPTFGFNAVHASFPYAGSARGVLIVHANSEVVLQRFYVLGANSNGYSDMWVRTFDPYVNSGEWGRWTKFLRGVDVAGDFNSPDNSTIPTTLSVWNLIPTNFVAVRSPLIGNEDLSDITVTGFYPPSSEMAVSNPSFPILKAGLLLVNALGNFVTQRYTSVETAPGKPAMEFYRSRSGGGWSDWMAVESYVVASESPSVSTSASGYTANIQGGSTDKSGRVSITRAEESELATTVPVKVEFQDPNSFYNAVVITPADQMAGDLKFWVSEITGTHFIVSVTGGLLPGGSASFYYATFKS